VKVERLHVLGVVDLHGRGFWRGKIEGKEEEECVI
jgi:hypothetical protein